MAKNEAKRLSYKEAWSRISEALEDGFHIEVVTICESISSDRLLSYVQSKKRKVNIRTPLGDLIKAWRELTEQAPPQFNGSNLVEQVDMWRKERNGVVHGLVKSEPGTSTEPVDDFLKDATAAAKAGKKLARAVDGWHKREFARHRREQRTQGKEGRLK